MMSSWSIEITKGPSFFILSKEVKNVTFYKLLPLHICSLATLLGTIAHSNARHSEQWSHTGVYSIKRWSNVLASSSI